MILLGHYLSLFTLTGKFVRCTAGEKWNCHWNTVTRGDGHGESFLPVNGPSDVEFTPGGTILVADRDQHRICVFSPDGSTLLRCFGGEGDAVGKFVYPEALAVHGDKVFAVDGANPHVEVFN